MSQDRPNLWDMRAASALPLACSLSSIHLHINQIDSHERQLARRHKGRPLRAAFGLGVVRSSFQCLPLPSDDHVGSYFKSLLVFCLRNNFE